MAASKNRAALSHDPSYTSPAWGRVLPVAHIAHPPTRPSSGLTLLAAWACVSAATARNSGCKACRIVVSYPTAAWERQTEGVRPIDGA